MIKEVSNLEHRTSDYCDEEHPDSFNPNWMESIPNEKLVSGLSIPGTHDSCARYGTFIAECQSWSIDDQLKAGIRSFDIRCRRVLDVFCIHHGLVYQHIHFGDVLNLIEAFLKQHPTEGIIMRVKEEYDPDNPTDTFENIFKKYVDAYPNLFLLLNKVPTMKELRGKIWVLQDGKSLGSYNWRNLNIQDDYDLGFFTSLDKKKQEIRDQMRRANDDTSNTVFANHCSATGILFQEPLFIAKQTNQVIFEGKNYKKIGITIFDFPGEGIIAFIISKNFSLDSKL
jgi:1-phosphatidylinositol phosphodiesterase